MFNNADELFRYIKDEDVKFIDVRFCDLPGVMQHFNVPVESVTAESSVPTADVRWLVDSRFPGDPRVGHEAGARLRHAVIDPFRDAKTVNMNFSIVTRSPVSPTAATRATSRPRPRRT